ncbi:sulfur carrier protein ThiS [Pelosinus sp. sgz500959]|uniref:sulfur carrier protein ThiS n=1 Tax=Pelosinus sp. sgz500959 TaxID=3242472 RepID=UPI00366C0CEC
MQVVLNGNQEMLERNLSLSEFVELKGLNPETIIVEYNGEIVKKTEWSAIVLKDDDCLEVLNFVGGG